MMSGELGAAKAVFKELIQNYPDFEWPYGNLGSLFIQEGRIDLAQDVLEKALQINRFYLNAWFHLTRARILASDFAGARKCLDEIESIDPTAPSLQHMRDTLEGIESWD